ncbi:hypothetical protein [Vibrio parahaemolyticus]|uniref:hypothetical protein n=1 Tax=Vibrio parahaemolyticus TaxID=670 RepID=UPI0031CCD11E
MFNMIIAIIAISLITIVSGAALYYGGDAFNSNTVEAEAARMRNERSQIIAAMEVYKSEGNSVGSGFKFKDLIEGSYLKQVPDGWIADNNFAYKPLDMNDPGSLNVCYTANLQDNFTFPSSDPDVFPLDKDPGFGIPYCDKENLDKLVPCCLGR